MAKGIYILALGLVPQKVLLDVGKIFSARIDGF